MFFALRSRLAWLKWLMITISFEVVITILINILRLVVVFETNSLAVRGIIHCVDLLVLVIIVKFITFKHEKEEVESNSDASMVK